MIDAVAIATQFRNELQAQNASAMDELTTRWHMVEAALKAEIEALAFQLSHAKADGQTVSESQLYANERYHALLVQLQRELAKYNADAAAIIQAQQLSFASMGAKQATAWLRYSGAIQGSFNQLGSGAFENIAALARAGNPLADLLSNAYPATAQAITDALLKGLALGTHPRTTARMMVTDGLTTSLNHALLLTRDQSIRASRLAALQQYHTSGLVVAYKRLAARQRRTCLACLALDGTVYPTNVMMPLHPQCRCTLLPILRSREPLAMPTAKQWFLQQDTATQRSMLGPGRYALWQKGVFQFEDLATVHSGGVWGATTQVTTVNALRQLHR